MDLILDDQYNNAITKAYPGPSWGLQPGLLRKLLLGEGSGAASSNLGDRIFVFWFMSLGISN